jgi:hypothetical protein
VITCILMNWKNVQEMDTPLDSHYLPKFCQEDIKHLYRSIMSSEIEAALKEAAAFTRH